MITRDTKHGEASGKGAEPAGRPPENVPRDGAMGGEPSSDICTAPVTGWAQQQSLGDTELRVSERVG